MASTATGFRGKLPVSQSNGAVDIPQPKNKANNKTATNLFSIRNLMLLFSIVLIFKCFRKVYLKKYKYRNMPKIAVAN